MVSDGFRDRRGRARRTALRRLAAAASLCAAAVFGIAAHAACTTDQVAVVQRQLAATGFDPGPADGMLGPRTRAAIKAWQRQGGLDPHGLLACEAGPRPNVTAPEAEAPGPSKVFRPTVAFEGGRYRGEMRDGAPHGRGNLIGPESRRYVGDWKDGRYHGRGVLVADEIGRYLGQFEDGRFHGDGMLARPDGSIYQGRFARGRFDGDGRLRLANGHRYVGAFKEGRPHGFGTLFRPGVEIAGIWANGCIDVKGQAVGLTGVGDACL